MGRKPAPENTRQSHHDADAIIQYLQDRKGIATESNVRIAADLGITRHRVTAARRHLATCPSLGGRTIAYRGKGKPISLIDPGAVNPATLIASLIDRDQPMLAGWWYHQQAAKSLESVAIAIIETAAKEAYTRGEGSLAEALSQAATDIRSSGDLHPSTRTVLRSLGVVV